MAPATLRNLRMGILIGTMLCSLSVFADVADAPWNAEVPVKMTYVNGTPASLRYVDAGPSSWTCTVRTAQSCSDECSCTNAASVTASCQGSEKVVAGGCSANQCNGLGMMYVSRPTQYGWSCAYGSPGYTNTVTVVNAYALCCT